MNDPACVILGGGGHARVLIDCLQAQGQVRIHGVLDPDQGRWGESIQGVPIIGGDEFLSEAPIHGVGYFVVGLGVNVKGDNRPRQRLFELGLARSLKPLTVRHPSAVCSAWAEIGPGCQLMPGCIVNAGARLGADVVVNSGAVVEHDCLIGDHAFVASGAVLASTVKVGQGAHIGAGASVRQSIEIGPRAVVGAGAVVVSDVPPGRVVAGSPARPLEKRPELSGEAQR